MLFVVLSSLFDFINEVCHGVLCCLQVVFLLELTDLLFGAGLVQFRVLLYFNHLQILQSNIQELLFDFRKGHFPLSYALAGFLVFWHVLLQKFDPILFALLLIFLFESVQQIFKISKHYILKVLFHEFRQFGNLLSQVWDIIILLENRLHDVQGYKIFNQGLEVRLVVGSDQVLSHEHVVLEVFFKLHGDLLLEFSFQGLDDLYFWL